MKKLSLCLSLIALLLISVTTRAQTLDQANFLFDQAESLYPDIFPTGPVTLTANELDSDWYYRFYASTGVYAAVNLTDGQVYTLGGPFTSLTAHGALNAILDQLGYVPPVLGDNAIVDAGNGNCVMYSHPTVGTYGEYETVTQTTEGEVTLMFDIEYLEVSESHVKTASSGSAEVQGVIATYSGVTDGYQQITNGWIFTTMVDTEQTFNVPGFGDVTSSTNIEFDPPIFDTPLEVCEGMVYNIAQVTSTSTSSITGFPGGPTEFVGPAGGYTVDILAVNESVSVPAGTFQTVHARINEEGNVQENWIDPATSLTVKSLYTDEDGNAATQELISTEK